MKRDYWIVFVDKNTKSATRRIEYYGTFKKVFEYAVLCCGFDEFVGSISCAFYCDDIG